MFRLGENVLYRQSECPTGPQARVCRPTSPPCCRAPIPKPMLEAGTLPATNETDGGKEGTTLRRTMPRHHLHSQPRVSQRRRRLEMNTKIPLHMIHFLSADKSLFLVENTVDSLCRYILLGLPQQRVHRSPLQFLLSVFAANGSCDGVATRAELENGFQRHTKVSYRTAPVDFRRKKTDTDQSINESAYPQKAFRRRRFGSV